MSVKQAAIHVLSEASEPLSAQQIADRVLEQGLWQTQGKTPHATVAQLYTDVKKHGEASDFVQVGPNTFALSDGAAVPRKAPSNDTMAIGKYSFTDAAEKVLEKCGNKNPMHYREITKKALELEWIATEGKTPEATMFAQVFTEIRRNKKHDKQPRFVQHVRGYFGLSRWMGKGIAFEIEQHNRRIRQTLFKRLLDLDATAFEELIAQLLAEIGFEDIEVTNTAAMAASTSVERWSLGMAFTAWFTGGRWPGRRGWSVLLFPA